MSINDAGARGASGDANVNASGGAMAVNPERPRWEAIAPPTGIVLAPMAGGVSTPRLCAAASNAGALGMLAGGYLSPERFADQAAAVGTLTDRPWGVNIFHPGPDQPRDYSRADGEGAAGARADSVAARAEWERYRRVLAGVIPEPDDVPEHPVWSDDAYVEKLDIAVASRAAAVSFTFGYPSAEEVARIHDAGKAVILAATSPDGVRAAVRAGADAVVLQGIGAGGHRATVPGADSDDDRPVADMLADAAAAARGASAHAVPVIAAGGVADAADVRALTDAGAAAVQVGTLFLTAEEAGTKAPHRRALLTMRDRDTTLTRAFSGKWARSIRNRLIDAVGDRAPGLYPEVNAMTGGLRARATREGDPEMLNLWAGEGFRACREEPAADVIARLAQ